MTWSASIINNATGVFSRAARAMGYDAAAGTPAELAAQVKLGLARYGKLIEAIGFKDE